MRTLAATLLLVAVPVLAQPAPDRAATAGQPAQAEVISEKPIPDADDPINRQAEADTVEALVLLMTLDGREARLEQAIPARVPRGAIQKRQDESDRVTVIALAGGRELARASVPDQLINIEEETGVVTLQRRQISLAVPLDRAPDQLRVLAPASGVDMAVDAGPLLAPWCRSERPGPWCPRRPQ